MARTNQEMVVPVPLKGRTEDLEVVINNSGVSTGLEVMEIQVVLQEAAEAEMVREVPAGEMTLEDKVLEAAAVAVVLRLLLPLRSSLESSKL